jgi:hypothetical protein
MDATAILKELRDQLAAVNQAITIFERIAAGGKRRRGRPPAWMKKTETNRGKAPKNKETV